MFSEVVELIEIDADARTELGGREPMVMSKLEVFANAKSARSSEFYQAMQSGMEIVRVFEIWKEEYNEERVIKHNDKYYTVIRTYEIGDKIEISCSRRKGLFSEAARV